jgi:hypothetical protein
MDLPTIVVIVLVGAALIGWLGGALDGRAIEAFGAGFIGYRSYGWPRGVQEEDSVHFSFDERPDPLGADDRPDGSSAEAELIELTSTPEALRLHRLS